MTAHAPAYPYHADPVARRAYLFPVPAKPLRSLLDAKAKAGGEFSEEEAALDVMLALDRDDLRPLRYLAARWGWSKNRVHRGLDDLRATAEEWRSFYADGPEDEPAAPGQPLGQVGTGVGQAGTKTGVPDTAKPGSGTGVGQAGTGAGQYRTDPDTRPISGSPPARGKPPPEVPDWIDPDAWAEWAQHRREIRKTLTPTAVRRQIKQLDDFRAKGHDPADVLRRSIANGWTGLFEPDEPRGGGAARGRSVDAARKRGGATPGRDDPAGAHQRISSAVDAALGL